MGEWVFAGDGVEGLNGLLFEISIGEHGRDGDIKGEEAAVSGVAFEGGVEFGLGGFGIFLRESGFDGDDAGVEVVFGDGVELGDGTFGTGEVECFGGEASEFVPDFRSAGVEGECFVECTDAGGDGVFIHEELALGDEGGPVEGVLFLLDIREDVEDLLVVIGGAAFEGGEFGEGDGDGDLVVGGLFCGVVGKFS